MHVVNKIADVATCHQEKENHLVLGPLCELLQESLNSSSRYMKYAFQELRLCFLLLETTGQNDRLIRYNCLLSTRRSVEHCTLHADGARLHFTNLSYLLILRKNSPIPF